MAELEHAALFDYFEGDSCGGGDKPLFCSATTWGDHFSRAIFDLADKEGM
ncbi:hypothetical protein [Enterocloster sp.]